MSAYTKETIVERISLIASRAQALLDKTGNRRETVVEQGKEYGSKISVRKASLSDRCIDLIPKGSIVVEARNKCDLYGRNKQCDWSDVRFVISPLRKVDIRLTDVEYRPFSGNRETVRNFWSDPEGGIETLAQAVIANGTDLDLLRALSLITSPLSKVT